MHRHVNATSIIVFVLIWFLAMSSSVPAYAQSDEVDKRFEALKVSFSNTSDLSFGPEATSSWKVTSGFVNKGFLARSLSSGITNGGITVSVTLPPNPFEADEAVVTTETVKEAACDAERGCNSNCDWYDLDCLGKKWDCERLKAMEKGACELKKSLQLSISNKKLLTVFLYDYDTGYDAGANSVRISGNGFASISGLKVSDELDKAELTSSVKGSALVTAKVRIKYEPAIKAALLAITLNPGCLIDQDTRFKDQSVNVDEPHLVVPISFSAPVVEGDHIKMDVQFGETTVLLHFDRSPVARLFENRVENLLSLLTCPLPILSVLVGEEFFPNDMMKKDQKLPAISKTQKISSIRAPVLGEDYVLTPVITKLAWGVKAERPEIQ
jgi:hypothetical protein